MHEMYHFGPYEAELQLLVRIYIVVRAGGGHRSARERLSAANLARLAILYLKSFSIGRRRVAFSHPLTS